jgi:hypothetical protein
MPASIALGALMMTVVPVAFILVVVPDCSLAACPSMSSPNWFHCPKHRVGIKTKIVMSRIIIVYLFFNLLNWRFKGDMVCEKDAVGIRSSIIGKVAFPMGKYL